MKAISVFNHITIDGIGYFEPEEKMTYDEAMKWAKTRGLRLLTRGEWCDLYDHNEEFRKSCRNAVYWTASEFFSGSSSFSREGAWIFDSYNGEIHIIHRRGSSAVRAVLAEPEGPHNLQCHIITLLKACGFKKSANATKHRKTLRFFIKKWFLFMEKMKLFN